MNLKNSILQLETKVKKSLPKIEIEDRKRVKRD